MSFDFEAIQTAEEHRKYLKQVEELMDLSPEIGSDEFELMECLAVLIEDYEKKTIDLGILDPIEAIKIRMYELGLKQRDLVPYIGSRSEVSKILNRKSNLTIEMMEALSKALGLPMDVFFN